MPEIRIVQSIREIGKENWDSCFPDVLENYDYLLAVEEAELPGFKLFYLSAWTDDVMVAGVPGFLTGYALDTTLTGIGLKIATAVSRLSPNFLKLDLACLGSPVTEHVTGGFLPELAEAKRREVLGEMVRAFQIFSHESRAQLSGVKDVPDSQDELWSGVLSHSGYKGIAGMPIARLLCPFGDLEQYLASLSYATRKDMRRKLKELNRIEVEYRANIDDCVDEIANLYHLTRSRAEMQFEDLPSQYFSNILKYMPGRSTITLYRINGKIIGFNLLLRNGKILLDKFFCMDPDVGRDYNLYFISWLANIDYCIDHHLGVYQSGQAGYENKLRLGSNLEPTTMYFKHHNSLVQGVLKMAAPLFAIDVPTKKVA